MAQPRRHRTIRIEFRPVSYASEEIRVDEALEEVVAKLGNTTSGFVDFSLDRDPTQKVWVNRDQVQMVRGK